MAHMTYIHVPDSLVLSSTRNTSAAFNELLYLFTILSLLTESE